MVTHWTVPYIIHGSLALVSTVLAYVILPETGASSLPEQVPDSLEQPDSSQCKKRPNSGPEVDEALIPRILNPSCMPSNSQTQTHRE